jgi:hypothetical protein
MKTKYNIFKRSRKTKCNVFKRSRKTKCNVFKRSRKTKCNVFRKTKYNRTRKTRGGGVKNVNVLLSQYLETICPNSNVCLAFGKDSATIVKFYDNFRTLTKNLESIRKIGVESVNGNVFELTYKKNKYKMKTCLKSSKQNTSDNLYYEFVVGSQFINKMNIYYPCFCETYGLYIEDILLDSIDSTFDPLLYWKDEKGNLKPNVTYKDKDGFNWSVIENEYAMSGTLEFMGKKDGEFRDPEITDKIWIEFAAEYGSAWTAFKINSINADGAYELSAIDPNNSYLIDDNPIIIRNKSDMYIDEVNGKFSIISPIINTDILLINESKFEDALTTLTKLKYVTQTNEQIILQEGINKYGIEHPINIRDYAKRYPVKLHVLIQYINDPITFNKFIQNLLLPNYGIELWNILFQVYIVLSKLADNFTHYDLHSSNILLYKIENDEWIDLYYNDAIDTEPFIITTQYIVKIIDYGRCYFKNFEPTTSEYNSSLDFYDKVCKENDYGAFYAALTPKLKGIVANKILTPGEIELLNEADRESYIKYMTLKNSYYPYSCGFHNGLSSNKNTNALLCTTYTMCPNLPNVSRDIWLLVSLIKYYKTITTTTNIIITKLSELNIVYGIKNMFSKMIDTTGGTKPNDCADVIKCPQDANNNNIYNVHQMCTKLKEFKPLVDAESATLFAASPRVSVGRMEIFLDRSQPLKFIPS